MYYILVLAAVFLTGSAFAQQCERAGERRYEGEECTCERSCVNWQDEEFECQCTQGCLCVEGLLRSESGDCVTVSECPLNECPEGEKNFGQDCLPCQLTCNRDDVECTTDCLMYSCGCIEDYVRDENNVCVPTSDCKCKFGEIFYGNKECLPGPLTCENWYRDDVPSTLECISNSCGCAPGHVKNESDICVSTSNCPAPVCNSGETFYTDGDCKPCEHTCENYHELIPCNMMCVLNRCGCSEGNVRNKEGVCVPISECPIEECGEGERNFGDECLPCQKTCNNWFRDDLICTRECARNKCGCIEDYVRDENNVCVPTSDCKCKFGEIFYGNKECLPGPLTCENWYRDDVPSTLECISNSCGCAPGHVKNESDICVSTSNCPAPVCNSGETFYTDGDCKPCEHTCENYHELIPCNMMCVLNRCGCSEGNVRNKEGVCVPISECPIEECGEGERNFGDECLPCQKTCNNWFRDDLICTRECARNKCGCIEDYVRDENNVCVPTSDCKCKFGEIFYGNKECLPGPLTCENWYRDDVPSTLECISNSCGCAPGHVKNESDICVSTSNCPAPVCNSGETFYTDGDCKPCEHTCENYHELIPCNMMCVLNRCGCSEGNVRNKEGVCVPISECPIEECGEGERNFGDECLPCQKTCNNWFRDDLICTRECARNKCGCIEDYVRDENNVCVPTSDCKCKFGEIFYGNKECLPGPLTCENWYRDDVPSTLECISNSCGCAPGHVKNESDICVSTSNCPAPVCNSGETFYTDGDCKPCEHTCENYHELIPCNMMCVLNRCGCSEGNVRNKEGVCVPISECPIEECGEGERNFGDECLPCQKTCNNWFRDDLICTRECARNKCGCIEDYVRDENNVCVPTSDCKCKFGERFYGDECLPCQLTCNNWYHEHVPCTLECIRDSCGCAEGYVKNDCGACVSISNCPAPVCNSGETFYTDGHCKPFEQTCENYQEGIPCMSNTICVLNRCGCSEGNVRNKEGVCVPTSECPVIQQ